VEQQLLNFTIWIYYVCFHLDKIRLS
jgi:hypothetical protein